MHSKENLFFFMEKRLKGTQKEYSIIIFHKFEEFFSFF